MIIEQFGTMNAANSKVSSTDLKPMGLFSDGAVLQRNRPLPVWGSAAGKRRITVRLGSLERVTYSAADGSFYLEFPPQEATSEPLTMTFSDGKKEVTVKNIVIGDVFHVSGQSNMQYALSCCQDAEWPVYNCPLRAFRVSTQAIPCGARDVDGQWITPDEPRRISGVGFFFAAEYSRMNNVPVGIIDTSIGGICGEAFASEYELRKIPELRTLMDKYRANVWTEGWCDEETDGDDVTPKSALLRRIAEAMGPIPALPEGYRNFMAADYDDGAWLSQDLPDSWTIMGYATPGMGLYRKRVVLPEEFVGKAMTVSLGACDYSDVCYANGELIGRTGSADDFSTCFTPRVYDVPAELNRRRELVLAVQVSTLCSVCTHGGISGPAEEMYIECEGKHLPIDGIWKMTMAVQSGSGPMESMTLSGAGEPKSFHCLFDSMIRPLAPYALAGMLFYQGEANTLCYPELYGEILKAVVNSWRTAWAEEELPVIIMTLPGYQRCHAYTAASPWARIRDEQFGTSMATCGHAPVNLADCGDVTNLHPPMKRVPGARAARVMSAVIQGNKPLEATWLTDIAADADGWTLTFAQCDSELMPPEGGRTVVGVTENGASIPLETAKISPFVLRVRRPSGVRIAMLTNGWSENPTDTVLKTANDVAIFPFRRNV